MIHPAPTGGVNLPLLAKRVAGHFARLPHDTPWLSAPALLFVVAAFVLPLGIIIWYSLHVSIYGALAPGLTVANYIRIFTNGAYYWTLINSILFVSGVSILVNVIAFPSAYFVAVHLQPRRRGLFIILTAIPFLTSYLTRVLAWLNILGKDGILNTALLKVGIISHPLMALSSGRTSVVITFAYLLVPLSFLTIYSALERVDPNLFDAASDLGARTHTIIRRVVLPAARNGILTGLVLVYLSLFGDYITPVMIGGTSGVLFVNLLVNQFGASMQWGFGAAMAVTMLCATFMILGALKSLSGKTRVGDFTRRPVKPAGLVLKAYAGLFLIFLYAPLVLLLMFALNSSSTVGLPMTGVTLKWFAVAIADPGFRSALVTSFKVGISSAVIGTALGACAAIPLAKSAGWFRNIATLLLSAPMFMPPVVLGIAILITMDALNVTRGLWTLIAGHTLLAVPIAFLVVMSRLEGVDGNQEQAAMDLGATPLRILQRVTLPQAMPALISSLLLTFAFSLDEFILTFLITGKDMTLPLFIYSSIRFQLSPSVIASASIVLMLSIGLIALGGVAYSFKGRGSAARTRSEGRGNV